MTSSDSPNDSDVPSTPMGGSSPGSPTAEHPSASEGDPINYASCVGQASFMLGKGNDDHRLTSGDRAQLRRVDPTAPVTPALWKALAQMSILERVHPHDEPKWATLLMCMAYCPGLHTPTTPLGEALAESGWSELRFVRIMEAEADALPSLLRRMAQYLASKEQPANFDDVRKLLFYTGDWAEDTRLRISRAYYRKLYEKKEKTAT